MLHALSKHSIVSLAALNIAPCVFFVFSGHQYLLSGDRFMHENLGWRLWKKFDLDHCLFFNYEAKCKIFPVEMSYDYPRFEVDYE